MSKIKCQKIYYMSHRLWSLAHHDAFACSVSVHLLWSKTISLQISLFLSPSLSLSTFSGARSPPKTLLSYISLPTSSFHYRSTHWTFNMIEITACFSNDSNIIHSYPKSEQLFAFASQSKDTLEV